MANPIEDLRTQYLAAQLHGDRREALRLVLEEGLGRGISPRDLIEGVVREAQREVGCLWQSNTIGIADEHMATAISQLVLAELYQRVEQEPPNGKRIIVACVQGERHDLPARLVADALETAGFSVRFLGADVPIDSLLEICAAHPPDLLALSATMSFHGAALRETVDRVRALLGPRLPIAIGGGACEWSPNLPDELGADITAQSASDLIERARRLLGVAA